MLHDFALQVRDHHQTIVSDWMGAVRQDPEIPTAQKLTEEELRDHLDGVLMRLAVRLTDSIHAPDQVHAPREAAVHGALRSRQDYQVEELVREVAVLRSTFLGFFSAYLKQTRQIEAEEFLKITQLVHRYFDEICRDSVAAYVRQRDEEAGSQTRRLQELNTELERSNQQYERADHYRRQTLRTVAHEMATPVNALGLGVNYLSESSLPAERLEARNLVFRTLEHLRTMLDQLYDFSRAEGGMDQLKVHEFATRPLFDYLVAGFEPIASAKGLSFEATLDPGLTALRTDENKVQRIGVNLLSNAIKYCEAGTIRLVLAELNEHEWQLEVSDTGCGIPPEDCQRIFSEFERLPRHSDQPGLGLGLSIVQTLTQRLGGRVELVSQVNVGSRFVVVLPRAL